MKGKIISNNGIEFYLTRLKKEEVDEALTLCDDCVGKDLYTKEELERATRGKDRVFCLLRTGDKKTAGYIYFLYTDNGMITGDKALDTKLINSVCGEKTGLIAILQSVGVREEYREKGLAVAMIEYALSEMQETYAEVSFVVCWKTGEKVPLHKAVTKCGYIFLRDAEMVWSNHPRLICPFCNGRCSCGAAIYYKVLKGETR